MTTILYLDFDGVIAVPYTKPEKLFPGVKEILKYLFEKRKFKICVVSFNPIAHIVCEREGLTPYLCHVRAGAHSIWEDQHLDIDKYVKENRKQLLSKSEQIRNIENHLDISELDTRIFLDDSPDNIFNVRHNLPSIKAIHVNCDEGLRDGINRALLLQDILETIDIANQKTKTNTLT
jgi:hypothetical protein